MRARLDPVPHENDLREYDGMCRACHGFAVVSGGAAPDLRASAPVLNKDAFYGVVRDGTLTANGMWHLLRRVSQ